MGAVLHREMSRSGHVQPPRAGDLPAGTAWKNTAYLEETGRLEQSLCQTGRVWHGPKWSNPQAPQRGSRGLFQHPGANDLF